MAEDSSVTPVISTANRYGLRLVHSCFWVFVSREWLTRLSGLVSLVPIPENDLGPSAASSHRGTSLMQIPIRLTVICLCLFGSGCDSTRSSDRGVSVAISSEAANSNAVHETDNAPVTTDRSGHDWPVFLGPHGTGVSDETGLLDEWPATGPRMLWEKRIGKGYSSPSILDGRVVVHHRQRDLDIIECLNFEDGTPIWKYDYETDFADPYGYNNGPRCSPLLTKTRCYTFGAQGRLVCLDLETGKPVWECDTPKKWKVPNHFFGAGCTPILEGNLLIVLVGG